MTGAATGTWANMLRLEAKRPLAQGLIASSDIEGQRVLSHLLASILGDPLVVGEPCYYSVPAPPIDVQGRDVIYHTAIFKKIVDSLGYKATPTNEAMAIVYSNCVAEDFSGLAISYGSGMVNVALAYKTAEVAMFSFARGGDWVDQSVAQALGTTASKVTSIKEKGIDLKNPANNTDEVIAVYIRNLIRYTLERTAKYLKEQRVSVDEPIPLVVSGGTTKAGSFLDVFKEEFHAIQNRGGFSFSVSEIRQATDPMSAVADGLLILVPPWPDVPFLCEMPFQTRRSGL